VGAQELAIMLRVETSFQDTPGDNFYFVLLYKGRPLRDQLSALGLKDGDRIILWDEECDGLEIEATLLFDYNHPMMVETALWAKAESLL
jgi:hypothetical protein